MIFRALKGLEDIIDYSVVHWRMLENGWTFEPGPGVTGDLVNGKRFLHEVYTLADPTYSGRVTVPVLWDKERQTIVSNEIGRDHPHAEFGLRRRRCPRRRLLSRAAAAGDRRAQRAHLRHGQQRRLQGRLRHDAVRL